MMDREEALCQQMIAQYGATKEDVANADEYYAKFDANQVYRY